MTKLGVRQRFWNRIEKLKGHELNRQDLSFLKEALPISELELLKTFSAVSSSTLQKEGVNRMQDHVAGILFELGFKIQKLKGEDRFGELVLAERPGKQSEKFITLVTHSDTVLSNDQTFDVNLPENKAFGSGVIDNKGGLTVGLSGLRRFLKRFAQTEYGLRFICSPNEEVGSIGFTEIFRDLSVSTAVGFGLEPALDNGSIIHQRRGNRWYHVQVKGQEGHAGRSYGAHVNAAHDLAAKIVALAKLNNHPRHQSVNVGHFSGGKDRYNIICGFAEAKVDVRFATLEDRESLHRKIERILAHPVEHSVNGACSETKWQIVDDCPPFSLTRRSRKIARSYAALISQIEERKVNSLPAGGAGDVNYLSTATNLILDGLGPVGGGMHTNKEFVHINTLETRSRALAGYLAHLQSQKLG